MLKHTDIVSERKKEISFYNITFFTQVTLRLQVLEMKNNPKTSAMMDSDQELLI